MSILQVRKHGKCTLEATHIKNQSLSIAGKLHMYYKRDNERDISASEKKGKQIQPVFFTEVLKKTLNK